MKTLALLIPVLAFAGCSAPSLSESVPAEFVAHVPADEDPGYTYMSGRTMGGRIFYPKGKEEFETGFRTAGGKVVRTGEDLEVRAVLVYDAELPRIVNAAMAVRFVGPLPADGEARWNLIHAALEKPALESVALGTGEAEGAAFPRLALVVAEAEVALKGEFKRPQAEVPFAGDAATALVSVFFLDEAGTAVVEVLPVPIEPAPEAKAPSPGE